MTISKDHIQIIVQRLKDRYPSAICSLKYNGEPWKLLVMGRLSAQCTDARVNIVCEQLYQTFPTLESVAYGNLQEIEEVIKPCGLYKMKAKQIQLACRMLIEEYQGVLPNDIDSLLQFPGVGRKIANLLLGDIYHMPAIVADTHCIRINGRLGFYSEDLKDPIKVEKILMKVIAPEEQSDYCHRMVLFGRDICAARNPKCADCPLRDVCQHIIKEG